MKGAKPRRTTLSQVAWLIIGLACAVRPATAAEAFVTTTTFEISGSTTRMQLDAPYSSVIDEYVVHSDAVVRHDGRYVYVLNRLFSDNVLVLDATNSYSVVQQYSITNVGANPRDLVRRDESKAYISLYESNRVWVGNPQSGAVLTTVDLSAFADADGLVEADQMARLGDHIFVAMQSLDRTAGWIPSGNSSIAVIDAVTDQLVDADPASPGTDAIALQFQNPFWEMRYEPILQRIVVLCAGRFLQLDGALEIINPFTLQSEGAMLTETGAGGDLLDFVLVHAALGYALIEKPNFDTCLIRFDPSTRTILGEVYCSNGFQLQDLELSLSGTLVVGDRTPSAPGLRLFDATSGAAIAGPLSVGLPPFDIVLIENIATAVGPGVDPSGLAHTSIKAWPNPARVGTRIAMRATESSPMQGRTWTVYDSRGRRLRQVIGIGDVAAWDGRDFRGVKMAPGVYFVRASGARPQTLKLTLLAD